MLVPDRPTPPGPPGTAAGPAMPGIRAQCSRGVPVDPPAAGRAGGCVPIPPPAVACWFVSELSCFACGGCGAGGCCCCLAGRGGICPLGGPTSRCCGASGPVPATWLSTNDKNCLKFGLLLPFGPAPGPGGAAVAGSDTCSARGGITPGRFEMLEGIGAGYPRLLSEVRPTPDACIGGIGPMLGKPLPATLAPGAAIEGLAIPIH